MLDLVVGHSIQASVWSRLRRRDLSCISFPKASSSLSSPSGDPTFESRINSKDYLGDETVLPPQLTIPFLSHRRP